jgi:hypothetical protein
MTIVLPSSEVRLPGGLRWIPAVIEPAAWQAHLTKHPLGLYALRVAGRAWNHEGWDATTPPVVTEESRAALLPRVAQLRAGRDQCGVPEFHGHTSSAARPECYTCKDPLLGACAELMASTGLGAYAALTEEVVRGVVDGVTVKRESLASALAPGAMRPGVWNGLLVLGFGRSAKYGHVARFVRADGLLVVLTLGPSGTVRWNTTYRRPLANAMDRFIFFLRDQPPRDRSLPLSESYVVPRAWWERHGT